MPISLKGRARPLDNFDIPEMAFRLRVSEDILQAFINVESASRGFDTEGRPRILFEPHVFYRNLDGADRDLAVSRGLAYRSWGEKPYPRDSYEPFVAAVEIDPSAAIMATSMGLSQVLGENYAMVGFTTPEAMWAAFCDDEQEHVEAMVRFILNSGIADDLQRLDEIAKKRPVTPDDCRPCVRVYNGSGYEKNGYHTKLAHEINKLRQVPDVQWVPAAPGTPTRAITDKASIKAAQERLYALGYPEVGRADGIPGTKLRAALLAFRADMGLPLVEHLDRDVMAALMSAPHREIGEARAKTTTADLRKAGSRQVAAADHTQGVAGVVFGGGGIGLALESLDPSGIDLGAAKGMVEQAKGLMSSLDGLALPAMLAIGGYIIWQQIKIKRARVEDTRTGKHVGR